MRRTRRRELPNAARVAGLVGSIAAVVFGCSGAVSPSGDGGVDSVTVSDGVTATDVIDGGSASDGGGGMCTGAVIMGASCIGPGGTALPPSCCTGWNCDTVHAGPVCESLPPMCMTGEVNTVVGMCWGPCVNAGNCAQIACGDGRCPSGFRCEARGGPRMCWPL